MVIKQNSVLAVLIVMLAALLAALAVAAWHGITVPVPGRSAAAIDQPPPLPVVGRPDFEPDIPEDAEIAPQTAKAINDGRPFSTARIVAAPPFASTLAGAERERAITCLAIAGYYEAGLAADDQMPVMQVVLNRARHPAFPNAICDVVFQGAERTTGCQFSFTCDGSMDRRRPSPDALARARQLAGEMLARKVDPRVGLATHYHTDWVVPYWSASLAKIVAIKTHLFFRWNGYWGTTPAFSSPSAAIEPAVERLASFDPEHGGAGAGGPVPITEDFLTQPLVAPGSIAAQVPAAVSAPAAPAFPVKRMDLPNRTSPGRWALNAVEMCGKERECRVVGWFDPARAPGAITPEALVISPPDFVYVQELPNRVQAAYWNCASWPHNDRSKCLGPPAEIATLVLAD